jgi:hypothetical protein
MEVVRVSRLAWVVCVSCRGKPLPGVTAHPAAAAGRQWGRPSAVTAIKTAALRTLCQALVPDSARATLTQVGGCTKTLEWGDDVLRSVHA